MLWRLFDSCSIPLNFFFISHWFWAVTRYYVSTWVFRASWPQTFWRKASFPRTEPGNVKVQSQIPMPVSHQDLSGVTRRVVTDFSHLAFWKRRVYFFSSRSHWQVVSLALLTSCLAGLNTVCQTTKLNRSFRG